MLRTLLLLFLPLISFLSSLSAQNPGCDGTRYKDDVFPQVAKSTVIYGTAVNAQGTTVTLAMDVYQPAGDTLSKRPAVVLAHGGSFMFGDRSLMQPQADLLAKKGYVAVSISYRLYPVLALGFPDSIDILDAAIKAMGDMKAAVRHLRLDAATTNALRIDPDHIFIGGYSAGAVTALHAAYVDADDVLPTVIENLITANGGLGGNTGDAANQSYSAQAEAVVNLSGGLYRSAWVDENDVPLTSIHGTLDETVPYVSGLAANLAYLEGSSLIHAQANLAGVPNYLETVTGGGHTNIYNNALYQSALANFWVQATTMLEDLTCAANSGVGETATLPVTWSLAPNPAGDYLRLEWPAEAAPSVDVQVLDLNGRVVRSVAGLQAGQPVSLIGLASGTYAVRVFGGTAIQFPVKLVVKS